jgi:hypothetical protein
MRDTCRFLYENLKGDDFEDIELDDRIILKRTEYIYVQDRDQWRTLTNKTINLGFELLTGINMKLTVFWSMIPCSPVERLHHFIFRADKDTNILEQAAASIFRVENYSHCFALKMKTARFSRTLV